jgi:hypothetical protein
MPTLMPNTYDPLRSITYFNAMMAKPIISTRGPPIGKAAHRRRLPRNDNLRGLMAAAARGWARQVPAAHRKRRLIDWLIEREAKTWEAVCREVEAEEAAGTLP